MKTRYTNIELGGFSDGTAYVERDGSEFTIVSKNGKREATKGFAQYPELPDKYVKQGFWAAEIFPDYIPSTCVPLLF